MGATKALGVCDTCGFRFRLKELKKNSYGMMVCPVDFDGGYDVKNHPQNKIVRVLDDETVSDPRPLVNLPISVVPVSAWLPPL